MNTTTWTTSVLASLLWAWSVCRVHEAAAAPVGVQLLFAYLVTAAALTVLRLLQGDTAQRFEEADGRHRHDGSHRDPRARPGLDGERATLRRYPQRGKMAGDAAPPTWRPPWL